jgi:hypothetical protein
VTRREISRSRALCAGDLGLRFDFRAQGLMPIARTIPETLVGETPHLFAIVTWVRLVPVSSCSIEVLITGGSLRGMADLGQSLQQFVWSHLQRMCQTAYGRQRRALQAPLQKADVVSVQIRQFREPLL